MLRTYYLARKEKVTRGLPADHIHQRLCDLRDGIGKSQKEVAEELNIDASVLSRIERGETKNVSHDLVIKLADYYGVSTDYLLCITDIRIRANIELEELGLTNKALLQLLQRKIDGHVLSQILEHRAFPRLLDTVNAYFTHTHDAGYASRNVMIDIGTSDIKDFIIKNPEHSNEGIHDIRSLNAEKITGTEADLEKIKNLFVGMLKDIREKYDLPEQDIESEELRTKLNDIKKQVNIQKKPVLNESDMAGIVMSMFQNTSLDLDEYEQDLFQKLMVHMLQRKR